MSAATRLAGWGAGPDGSLVTWTVSDGRRGRRWREVVSRGPDVSHALLLETDPGGRFSHLELARSDGLWTFHPEGDGTLHGNHVDPRVPDGPGVRHVEGWRFDPGDVLVVEGSSISLAAIAHAQGGSLVEGGMVVVGGVVIGTGDELRHAPALRIERLSRTRWRVGEWSAIEVDEDGIPLLAGGERHPLELG